jgi:formate dehydrogenase beta subunit
VRNAVIDTSGMRRRDGGGRPKGRQVDPRALAEVRTLLGDAPRRRDLLIEFLHRIQDVHGCIAAAHIVALAQEMGLAMTEVYEVATFYHHFDVIKEGDARPPALTVRVCETLSCQMAGAEGLRAAIAAACGPGVRVIGAPCIGRCEQAPAAVVGRNPVDRATVDAVMRAVAEKRIEPQLPSYLDYASYRAGGGYRALQECVDGVRPL